MEAATNSQIRDAIRLVRERGIVSAINALNTYLYNTRLTKVITRLFTEMALWTANQGYRQLFKFVREFTRQEKAKDSGAFGFNEEWVRDIDTYLQQYLLKRAVLPITETVKKAILEALKLGNAEGWGVDRMIQELRNLESEGGYLARMRVRTELSNAANFGYKMMENKIPFETDKGWIAARDARTRNSHRQMNGVIIDSNADFHVPIIKGKVQIGIDLMTGPGDPEASAGNVINCRCTLYFIPRRDKNKRLIKKQTPILT